jgi:signal peptidase I
MTLNTSLPRFFQEAKNTIISVLFVFVSTTAIAQPFYVPSGSMEPTIQIGDGLLGAKYPYGYSRYSMPFGLGPHSDTRLFGKTPRRGDVVIFRLPRDPGVVYVKRLIGLPGDTVQMVGGRLIINGKIIPMRRAGTASIENSDGTSVSADRYIETLPGGVAHVIVKLSASAPLDNTQSFHVPAGHFFMMGDNRDNSLDSRVPEENGGVGFVPAENIMARGDVVVGSYDFLNARAVWDWVSAIRFNRFFHAIT